MAVHSLYFKNAAPSGATTSLSLQDGGTAPTGALTTTGWTVAKLASPNLAAMLVGTKRGSIFFTSSDAIGSFAASACWRSENTFAGNFANANWTLAFRVRAQTAASSQTGAVKVRIWKSTNADGTGATELTSSVQTGTTTAALTTSASATSTVTWSPGAVITLINEYLWVQCEWSIVATSGSTTADATFYVESAGVITTSDLPQLAIGTFAATEAGDTAAVTGMAVPSPTKLLLHFDGADASTTFTDSSFSNHVVTGNGSAQLDTAQSEFGTASGYFTAANDYLTLDDAADFTFGTGDFTIETWVRRETTSVPLVLIDFRSSINLMPPYVYYDTPGELRYYCNGADRITATATLAVGTWHHVAIARAGSNTRLFLDGTQVGSTYVAADNLTCASTPRIGTSAIPPDQAETTAWVARVVGAGGSVSAGRKAIVNDLIFGLKADGIWIKLDGLWVFAGENSQGALIDLVGLPTATAINSPTFTADRGYTGNGSSSYIDTNFNPVTATSPKWLQNDSHWAHWNNTNDTSNQVYSGQNNNGTSFQAFSGQLYLRINDGAGPIVSTDPTSFWICSRQSSAGSSAYHNGALSSSIAVTSSAPSNENFFILAANGAFEPSPTQASAYSIGGGLSPTEATNYYNRMRTYMTAIGVP